MKGEKFKVKIISSFLAVILLFSFFIIFKDMIKLTSAKELNNINLKSEVSDFTVKRIAPRDDVVRYFTVEFTLPISYGKTEVGGGWKDDVQNDPLIGDNILIGDKSVKYISDNAQDTFGNPLQNAIHVNIRRYPDQTNYGLEIWMHLKLRSDFRFDATSESGNKITFKKGLTFSYKDEKQETIKLVKEKDETLTYYRTTKMWQPDSFTPNPSVPKIKKISTIINDDNEKNFVQYLLIDFIDEASSQNINHADYKALLDNIEINGKNLNEIKANGVDKNGEKVLDATYVLFSPVKWFAGDDRVVMMIYLQRKLDDNFLMDKTKTNRLVFKKGLTLPNGSKSVEDMSYEYSVEEDFWVSELKVEKEYKEVKVSNISRFVEDLTAGKNHYFIIYFDKSVSAQFLPHVNASISWIQGINNIPEAQRPFYYSNSALQALVRDKIRVSILDYIVIDGETIREKMAKETGDKDISIIAHYQGQGSENGLLISFAGNGVNKMDLTKEHEVTLKKGFKTPQYNMLFSDVTYKYNPDNMQFTLKDEKKQDTDENKKGCGAVALNNTTSGTGKIGLTLMLSAVLLVMVKRLKIKEIKTK